MTRMTTTTRMTGKTTIRSLLEPNADIAMALENVRAQIVIMENVFVAAERAILIAEITRPLVHGVKEENVRHAMETVVALSAMAEAICNQDSEVLT